MKRILSLLAVLLALVPARAGAQQVNAQQLRLITGPCLVRAGSGSPEGSVIGHVCDIYTRTDGSSATTLYVKTSGSGNTGWSPVANAAGYVPYSGATGNVNLGTHGLIGASVDLLGSTSGDSMLSTEAVGGNFLDITGGGAGSGINMIAGTPGSGSSRNFALVTNYAAYGMAELLQGTTSSGNALSGPTLMAWTSGAVRIPATNIFYWNTRSVIGSSTDGAIQIGPNSGTTGVTLETNTDGTLKVNNFANNAVGALVAEINAETTGTKLTTVEKIWLSAGQTAGASSSARWSWFSGTPGTSISVGGSNIATGWITMPDAAPVTNLQEEVRLPGDWTSTGGVDLAVTWASAATTGAAKFFVSVACSSLNGGNWDPSFGTATTVTTTVSGSSQFHNLSNATGLTVSGCSAGDLMHINVKRDASDGADTLGADLWFIGAELTFRRAQ